ncbi:hypothetical protein DBR47_08750 [Paucibacter sp. KBW04]|uniref:ATP-binding response regulator n=1 Tax=Paucibacter sp. KBW04 TaxID=2153361 RepID=UPI000F57445C|nr:hybrid sensor histidine kinase/response regulator [Paucibacter sp. KBW04]RQO60440.1 hypothetical protein DBR47_08750 [Paucibacter sp. KBW04]
MQTAFSFLDKGLRGLGSWLPPWPLLPRRFEGEREQNFLLDFTARLAPLRRTALILGGLTWLSYLLLDHALAAADANYRAVVREVVMVRLGAALLFVILFLLTRRPRFKQDTAYADRLVLLGSLTAYIAMCMLTVIVPHPFDQLYFFTGMVVVAVAVFTLFGLRASQALQLAACLSMLSALTIGWCVQGKGQNFNLVQSQHYPLSTALFLSTVGVMGCVVCYLLEVFARRSFMAREDLAHQNEAVRLQGEELHRVNLALAQTNREVQERMQAVLALKERLRVEAEQRSRDKSRFIASAVHDLRQPVQAIVNVQRPLERAILQADVSEARALLSLSRMAAASLHEQLAAILDISRLESGMVKATPMPVDVRALIRSLQEGWEAQAAEQQARFYCEMPQEPLPFVGFTDPQFLLRILNNLISNAIKYRDPARPDGAWLKLQCRQQGQVLTMTVVDNGIGIPQSLIDEGSIFRPFFQANNHLSQGDKGVGLGLAIVKALLALLPDHQLGLQSRLGEGSSFSLTLPAASPGAARSSPGLPSDGHHYEHLQGLYVLLVEDDDLVRDSTQRLLASAGMVCEAFASLQAFEAALPGLEREPDVVLSDYRLPGDRTAVDVLRSLRQGVGEIPMLVFSGESGDFSRVPELADLPALRKPVTPETLLQALLTLCPPRPDAGTTQPE